MPAEQGCRSALLALAVLLALAGVQPVLAGEDATAVAPRQAPATETTPGAASGPAGNAAPPPASDGRPAPQPGFTPSEEIGADSVVSFPVDI